MKFAFRSSRQPMSTERETTKRSLSQSVMQSVMQWSCLLFAQRCVCVMPWDDALPLLIMCYRFHFFIIIAAAKVFNFKCRTAQKVIMHELRGNSGRNSGREFGEIHSLALQFQFFMSKNILHTRFFWSVLRDYQLWNKLYLILVGERFIEFNKNILWTLFYGPTVRGQCPKSPHTIFVASKRTRLFFVSPSGQLGENPRETVAKQFLLAVLRLAEQFYYWYAELSPPCSSLPLCSFCLPLCCAIIVENCKLQIELKPAKLTPLK